LLTIEELLSSHRIDLPGGAVIGHSPEGRPIHGYRFGSGDTRISLIAGCHADEPVGPMLLDRLARYLCAASPRSKVLTDFSWWVVPHVNPDGAERNRAWADHAGNAYDFTSYLKHVVRELPGDDIEFGFPRDPNDQGARPEPRAIYAWWQSDPRPFLLHVTLHGMGVAGGPWFLIDPDWTDRCDIIMERCRIATEEMGYVLHDVERHGEKGFHRIDRGFCTRPNSRAKAEFFLERNDPEMASRFRPSSMETIRALGGDPLTLVSEMPLFILPGVGDQIEPIDPVAEEWRGRIGGWQTSLADAEAAQRARTEIEASSVQPVPILDQLTLQWAFVAAGIEQIQNKALPPESGSA